MLGGRGQGGSLVAQNWLDLNAERGLSNFDQRHQLEHPGAVQHRRGLGGGALMSGWRGALFKEWTFSTQLNIGSGLPLTPVYFAVQRAPASPAASARCTPARRSTTRRRACS